MTRESFVYRNGRVVPKHSAPPRRDRVHVISDSLGEALEHHAYADGRRTDSKSQFRRWTREAGVVEKGNDRERPQPVREQSIAGDVAQAYQMVKQGYRPRLFNIEGD
jgi:hypothetical protein